MTEPLKDGEHVDLDSGAMIENVRGESGTYLLQKYNPYERRDEYVFVSRDDIRQFAELVGYEVNDR